MNKRPYGQRNSCFFIAAFCSCRIVAEFALSSFLLAFSITLRLLLLFLLLLLLLPFLSIFGSCLPLYKQNCPFRPPSLPPSLLFISEQKTKSPSLPPPLPSSCSNCCYTYTHTMSDSSCTPTLTHLPSPLKDDTSYTKHTHTHTHSLTYTQNEDIFFKCRHPPLQSTLPLSLFPPPVFRHCTCPPPVHTPSFSSSPSPSLPSTGACPARPFVARLGRRARLLPPSSLPSSLPPSLYRRFPPKAVLFKAGP